MNYIQKLQQQVDDLKREKAEAKQAVDELKAYLQSEKFQAGELAGYVNVKDVLNRLVYVEKSL